MSARPLTPTFIGCLGALFLHVALPTTACGQAWLPLKSEGQVTFTYQNIRVRDHLDSPARGLTRGLSARTRRS